MWGYFNGHFQQKTGLFPPASGHLPGALLAVCCVWNGYLKHRSGHFFPGSETVYKMRKRSTFL